MGWMTVQISVLQLDNYGPWTVTPEPRREMDLQALQSRLFGDVAQFVGSRGGYVFPNRFDNMIAVTNGLVRDDFETLQETIDNHYPVTASISTGIGSPPVDALSQASTALQETGSAQDPDRRELLCGTPLPPRERTRSDVQVAHFDVIDATERYTDAVNAYDAYVAIDRTYRALRDHLYDRHGAISYFVGGDNIIALCPDMTRREFDRSLDAVSEIDSAALRVGVGTGATACEAGLLAKDGLERCRESGSVVETASAKPTP
jgi:GTP cyclohydrolase IIa